jgi:hypothetical protein
MGPVEVKPRALSSRDLPLLSSAAWADQRPFSFRQAAKSVFECSSVGG